MADNKGNVLNLTDGTAPVAGVTYQYDAYGVVLKSPTISIPNPFQYNGEWTDSFSQLQYLRARFYHPKLMRFVQQDSYDLVNRFSYGDGNPIVNSDPSGHFSVVNFAISWLVPGYETYYAFKKDLPIYDKIISIGMDAATIISIGWGVYKGYQKIAGDISIKDFQGKSELEKFQSPQVQLQDSNPIVNKVEKAEHEQNYRNTLEKEPEGNTLGMDKRMSKGKEFPLEVQQTCFGGRDDGYDIVLNLKRRAL